jgi:hypothetical protein
LNQQEVSRLLHRIQRNCEAMVRILDEPDFPAVNSAIHKRILAFASREEQLMRIVGPMQSHMLAFGMLGQVLKHEERG